MTLSGALKDDTAAMQAGCSFVTGTDATGRAVFIDLPDRLSACTAPCESKARAFWYHIHEALTKYEDAQKKGVIFVIDASRAKFSDFDRKLSAIQSDTIKGCWPIRLSCVHICRPPAFVAFLLPIIKILMGPVLRKRFRFHAGSVSKVAESLEADGIPKKLFPSDIGGDFKIPV
jgi:CRAL/TRIO domain